MKRGRVLTGRILNPVTGRMVKKTGKRGREVSREKKLQPGHCHLMSNNKTMKKTPERPSTLHVLLLSDPEKREHLLKRFVALPLLTLNKVIPKQWYAHYVIQNRLYSDYDDRERLMKMAEPTFQEYAIMWIEGVPETFDELVEFLKTKPDWPRYFPIFFLDVMDQIYRDFDNFYC